MKGYRYSLRFALDPETDTEQRIEALPGFCEKAKIDDVMFFIGAEDLNCGHITAEESVPYMEAIPPRGQGAEKEGDHRFAQPVADARARRTAAGR